MAKITNAAQAAQAAAAASAKKAAAEKAAALKKKNTITNVAQAAQAAAINPVSPQIVPAPVITNVAQAAQASAVNPVAPQIAAPIISNPAQAAQASAQNPVSPQIVEPVISNPAMAAQASAINPVSPQIKPTVPDAEQGRINTMEQNVYNRNMYQGESGIILPGGIEGRFDIPHSGKPETKTSNIPSGTQQNIGLPGISTAPETGTLSNSDNIPSGNIPSGQATEQTNISKTGSTSGNATVPEKPINEPYEKLKELKFEYNPSQDAGYQQAMAAAENAIVQSMISRGGLYSSVAQSAIATKLMDLTIEYEKLAYDKYLAEREFLFDLANFEQNKINTEWDQNFDLYQFESDQEQRAFENEMTLRKYEFEVEKEVFDRRMQLAEESAAASRSYSSAKKAQADRDFAETGISIMAQLEKNKDKMLMFEQMRSEWEKEGKANIKVSTFFSDYGIQYGDNIATNMNVITKRHKQLEAEKQQLIIRQRSLEDADLDRKFLSSYSK